MNDIGYIILLFLYIGAANVWFFSDDDIEYYIDSYLWPLFLIKEVLKSIFRALTKW